MKEEYCYSDDSSLDYQSLKKRRRLNKFKDIWLEEFECLQRASDNSMAICRACNIQISIGNGGITDIRRHFRSKKHSRNLKAYETNETEFQSNDVLSTDEFIQVKDNFDTEIEDIEQMFEELTPAPPKVERSRRMPTGVLLGKKSTQFKATNVKIEQVNPNHSRTRKTARVEPMDDTVTTSLPTTLYLDESTVDIKPQIIHAHDPNVKSAEERKLLAEERYYNEMAQLTIAQRRSVELQNEKLKMELRQMRYKYKQMIRLDGNAHF